MSSSGDTDFMARAVTEQRTVITADLDYPRLLAMAGTLEPSIILFRDGNWSDIQIVRRMAEVLKLLTADEIAQSIITVERERVRRRRLPL